MAKYRNVFSLSLHYLDLIRRTISIIQFSATYCVDTILRKQLVVKLFAQLIYFLWQSLFFLKYILRDNTVDIYYRKANGEEKEKRKG